MLAGKALGLTDALMVSGVGIVVVMAELAVLAVLVFLLSRLVSAMVSKKSTKDQKSLADSDTSSNVKSQTSLADTTSTVTEAAAVNAGVALELIGVDEPTAATAMAVVSHQTGIPLDKLDFRRIRSLDWDVIDEPTVAIIMALVSHQSGIPLERLDFKSIKLIEE